MSNYPETPDSRKYTDLWDDAIECVECHGTGIEKRTDDDPCPACYGEGYVPAALDHRYLSG